MPGKIRPELPYNPYAKDRKETIELKSISSLDFGLKPVTLDSEPITTSTKKQALAIKKPGESLSSRFSWSIALLLIGILIFSYASVRVYATNFSNSDEDRATCEQQLAENVRLGLQLKNLSCEYENNVWNTYINPFPYRSLVDHNAQQLTQAKQNIQTKIHEQNTVNQSIIRTLEGLEVTPEFIPGVETSESLATTLETLENQEVKLKEALKYAEKKPDRLLTTYQNLLSYLPESERSEHLSWLQTVKSLSTDQKVINYRDFRVRLTSLQSLINQSLSGTDAENLGMYLYFTGDEFHELNESITYPGTILPKNSPSITGDELADRRIIQIAERRGYRLRYQINESDLVSVDGQRLHPKAKQAWQDLKQAAKESGVQISLVSGYRSDSDQRTLFLSRFLTASQTLKDKTFTNGEIAAGEADEVLESVLKETSIPGYSRHHSGFTIDVAGNTTTKKFTKFKDTPAYTWISANNFLQAKRFGFIPSYPPNQKNVGPEPEEWEFVWVGTSPLQVL